MIVISKTLVLGDWYQLKHIVTGKLLREWVIQDINVPELDPHELHSITNNISFISLYPNIIDTLGVCFGSEMLSVRETFARMHNTAPNGFMSWETVEEAKIKVSKFLLKYSKLKAFS